MDVFDKASKAITKIYRGASTSKATETSHGSDPPSRQDLPDPAASIVPHGILGFRTITLLYSKIAQQTFTYRDTPRIKSQTKREQIRILNALANVAVAEHAVVAVMLKGKPADGYNEVIFSIGSSESVGPLMESQQDNDTDSGLGDSEVDEPAASSPGFFTRIFRYFHNPVVIFAQNPRKDEITNGTRQTSRTDFSIPVIETAVSDDNPKDDLYKFMAPCW